MSKKIIVCSDGTWNKPDQKKGDKYSPSNVVKMARAILPENKNGETQIVFYDPSVGTSGKVDRLTGGAFGRGLDKNVEDNYRFIIYNFSEGDEIFLFGFSRGAFTVRSTAGLIRNCGILKKENSEKIPEALKIYRSRAARPDSYDAENFMEKYAVKAKINFIGVWDTVGSLGIPIGWLRWITKRKYQFHDVQLSSQVKNAYHALAIDEKRSTFKPTLWSVKEGADQSVEQVWFPGVHSSIGGGYSDSGLSDIAFKWMKDKAIDCGLEFDQEFIKKTIKPNHLAEIPDSKTGIFKFSADYFRPINKLKGGCEKVDNCAVGRYETINDYRPKNLIEYLKLS